MKPSWLVMSALMLPFVLSGCLYMHTVQPLTLDANHTPVSSVEKHGTISMIGLPPIPRYGGAKLAAWGSAAIGAVAKKEGMQEVYYSDLEMLSILMIWNEYTVHVYGK